MGSRARVLLLAVGALAVTAADAKMRRIRWRGPLPHARAPAPVPPGPDAASLPDRDKDGFADAAELSDPLDRAAFRRWNCALAGRPGPGGAAADGVGLLAFLYKESLALQDRRRRGALLRTGPGPASAEIFSSSATAQALRDWNMRLLGKGLDGLEDGDVLFFHRPWEEPPDEALVLCGGTLLSRAAPSGPRSGGVRTAPLNARIQHPDPRRRPLPTNPYFLGVYRWRILD